jgi:thiamine biosynthesis protein ThiS
MKIVVNGEAHVLGGTGTLRELLAELKASPDHVAVMVNDRIVPKAGRDALTLRAGDRVEVLTFMGGG